MIENKELKERFIDERTGIEYSLVGDFQELPIEIKNLYPYGKAVRTITIIFKYF